MKLDQLRQLFAKTPRDTARAIQKRSKKVKFSDDSADFRYRTQKDGKDALFLVGQHKFHTVSQVQREDPGYLDWVLSQSSFPDEIKEIIRHVRSQQIRRVLGPPIERKSTVVLRSHHTVGKVHRAKLVKTAFELGKASAKKK